jgi:hypothetical protein
MRHLKYAAALLLAYLLWLGLIALDAAFRAVCLVFIPVILIWSGFGMGHTQQSAQATASLGDLFLRRWPRRPRINWSRLFPGSGGRRAADSRVLTGEVLEPLEKLGKGGV